MKNAVTLKHLFKVVGKKGQAMGSEEACIYFDGRHAVGANGEATVSIDCPLQINVSADFYPLVGVRLFYKALLC